MKLDIVTPERRLKSVTNTDIDLPCEVKLVIVPGAEGQFEVLPGHAPVLALLGNGALTFETEAGKRISLEVSGGFCEVDDERVTVMCQAGTLPEEIDLEDERRRHAESTKTLAQMGAVGVDDEEFKRVRAEVERATTKLTLLK